MASLRRAEMLCLCMQPAASAGSARNSRSASPARSNASASGSYSKAELENSASQKEQFFANRMAANASRPDHLPPNQGGKYVGFGSGGSAPPRPPANNASIDQVTTMLSSGWSQLSTVAGGRLACMPAEWPPGSESEASGRCPCLHVASVHDSSQPEAELHGVFWKCSDCFWPMLFAGTAVSQVRSGEVQQTASVVAEKGREYGVKGWGLLRGIAATVATQVENAANEHGYSVDLGGRLKSN